MFIQLMNSNIYAFINLTTNRLIVQKRTKIKVLIKKTISFAFRASLENLIRIELD